MATGRSTKSNVMRSHQFAGASTSTWTIATIPGTDDLETFQIEALAIKSTSITMNTPAGWTKVLDDTSAQSWRLIVCYRTRKPGDALFGATSFTWNGGQPVGQAVGNTWRGVDPDNPFLVPPSMSWHNTGTASSMALPTISSPDGTGVGWWVWFISRTSGTNSATITLPSDLPSWGNGTTTLTNGMAGRCGVYTTGNAGGEAGVQTPTPTGTKSATQSGSGSLPWRGIGCVLRPWQRSNFVRAFW